MSTQPETVTVTTTKCPSCGGELRTISMTSGQVAPYPPITTTFTHPCEVCSAQD